MNRMESEVLTEKLDDLKIKLGKTITQIQLIENNLRDMNQRIRRASTNKKNSFRYNLKMKSSITGGVKIMYRLYLTQKAEEVRVLEQELAATRRRQEQLLMDRAELRQQLPPPDGADIPGPGMEEAPEDDEEEDEEEEVTVS